MRVLCFGDSNTYGYDPRGFLGERYPAEYRWCDLLAENTGWDVINAGMNGRDIPSDDGIFRLLERYAPADVLLVMLGTNNLLEGYSAGRTAAKMEVFLERVIPHCKKVLLVSPPPMVRGAWVDTEMLVESSRMLAEKYENVAKKREISFLNTNNWQIPMTFDGVHFTEAGHADFVKKLLENWPLYTT